MVDGLKFGRSKTGLNARFSKDTPLHDVRYAVLDTELTSLDTRSNRLLDRGNRNRRHKDSYRGTALSRGESGG